MISRYAAAISARLSQFLTDTCDIDRMTDTVDSVGATVQIWQSVARGVACRVIDAGSNTAASTTIAANQQILIDANRLILPLGTEIGINYRVTVNAAIYKVVSVLDGRTNGVDVQAVIERLTR